MAYVPLPLGSQTIPVPQLPASNSNSSQGLNCRSPLTDGSPTNSLQCTNSTQLNSVGRVIQSWSRPTENATCNTSSIVVWHQCVCEAFLCCMCIDHYLATGLHATVSSCDEGKCRREQSWSIAWHISNLLEGTEENHEQLRKYNDNITILVYSLHFV
jgi:hypothetical protein